MDPDDRAVDDRVFKVRYPGQATEDPFKYAVTGPAPEPFVRGVPLPEAFRKIPPGRPSAGNPQDAFQEQAIICPAASGISGFATKQRCRTFPLLIAQKMSIQGQPPRFQP